MTKMVTFAICSGNRGHFRAVFGNRCESLRIVGNRSGSVRVGASRCEFFGRHIKATRLFARFSGVHKKTFAYAKTVLAKV
jgi:hypothetical protein